MTRIIRLLVILVIQLMTRSSESCHLLNQFLTMSYSKHSHYYNKKYITRIWHLHAPTSQFSFNRKEN